MVEAQRLVAVRVKDYHRLTVKRFHSMFVVEAVEEENRAKKQGLAGVALCL
jgi:hypothetical protein